MTKAELIDAVAAKAGCTKKVAGEVIAAFTETIQAADKVALIGFGTFERKTRAARDGINPATKEKIKIPASEYLHFKASKKK